ncbi:HET-domain-containing protein, partial [Stipitochalara longipes BDJ]
QETKDCINNCMKFHKDCMSNTTAQAPPKRLIDVGKEDSNILPRLYETRIKEFAPYVALSYCWGGKHGTTTTENTLKSHIQGLPLEKLSKTIVDAITITRGLGIRYLWVDALCIVQDNSDDMISQINAMGSIYQNATLTVAAANSASAAHGFLGNWPIYQSCQLPLLLPNGKTGTISINTRTKIPENTSESPEPLDTRGWTLQEFLLSPRVLYFGRYDMTWHCQTKSMGGAFSTVTSYAPVSSLKRLPAALFRSSPKLDQKDLSKRWAGIVERYTLRTLTNMEDLLPALAGIAERFQKVTKDHYLAGMWKSSLVQYLGWDADSSEPAAQKSPTWSWVSGGGAITFYPLLTEDAKFVGCATTLKTDKAPLGTVLDGWLSLDATVIQASVAQASLVIPKAGQNSVMNFRSIKRRKFDDGVYWLLLGYDARGRSIGLAIKKQVDGTFEKKSVLVFPKDTSNSTSIWLHPSAKWQRVTIV